MKAYKAILRAYGGFKHELLSSTTIAGGLVYGMLKNNDKKEYNVLFSNFKSNENKTPIYTTRVKLNRVVNESEPYLNWKFLEKASRRGHKISIYNYVEYEGYIIAEKEDDIKELFEKYGFFIGNNFVIFELGELKPAQPSKELYVNSLPVINLDALLNGLKDVTNVNVRLQRFTNSNYLNITPSVIYYDINEKKMKIKEKEQVIYLVDFECKKDSEICKDIGSFPYDFSDIKDVYTRQYIRMGFGVISPSSLRG